MTQRMDALIEDRHHVLEVPSPEEEVVAGVKWGRFDHLFTPAYWFSQAWYQRSSSSKLVYRLGDTLVEEVAALRIHKTHRIRRQLTAGWDRQRTHRRVRNKRHVIGEERQRGGCDGQ